MIFEDLCNVNCFKKINHKIDIVLHLASITNAEASVKDKKRVYKNNFGAFKNIPDTWNKAINSNPKEALGFRSDFTPEIFKHFVDSEIKNGASIVGGCCETYPEHISAISN